MDNRGQGQQSDEEESEPLRALYLRASGSPQCGCLWKVCCITVPTKTRGGRNEKRGNQFAGAFYYENIVCLSVLLWKHCLLERFTMKHCLLERFTMKTLFA
jgi:hypothetical protein